MDTEYRTYALGVSGLGFSNDRYELPRWCGVSLSYDFLFQPRTKLGHQVIRAYAVESGGP